MLQLHMKSMKGTLSKMAKNLASEETSIQLQTLEAKPTEPLILPESFKTTLNLEAGGTYTALHLDDMVLLISRPLITPQALNGMGQALNGMGQALQAADVSLEDLLANLANIRTQMLHERYGLTASQDFS